MISLHGCRYCKFDFVVAVACDASGDERRVARWRLDSASNAYVIAEEYGPNPPGWLEVACSMLPNHEKPGHKEQNETRE